MREESNLLEKNSLISCPMYFPPDFLRDWIYNAERELNINEIEELEIFILLCFGTTIDWFVIFHLS